MHNHENEKVVNARRWTETELEMFASVLVDEKNDFSRCLEKLAAKKASNSEMFDRIRVEFRQAMENKSFQQKNSKHFKAGKPPTKLNCEIDKLRQRYKVFKQEWCRRVNHGDIKASSNDTLWLNVVHPVFSGLIDPTKMNTSPSLTTLEKSSFVTADDVVESKIFDGIDIDYERHNYTMCDTTNDFNTDRDNNGNNTDRDKNNDTGAIDRRMDDNGENEAHQLSGNTHLEKSCLNVRKTRRRTNAVLEATSPRDDLQEPTTSGQKRKMSSDERDDAIRSHTKMLEKIAQCFTDSIAAQDRRFELQMKEIRDREERLLKFRSEEAEKDRQHEFRMAELLLAAGRPMPPISTHKGSNDIPIVSVPSAKPLSTLKKDFPCVE